MKQTKSFFILMAVLSAFVFGAVISETIGFERSASAQQAGSSKRWETMVVRGIGMPESLQGSMNMRGEEGWEPVTVLQTKDGNFIAYLKRRK